MGNSVQVATIISFSSTNATMVTKTNQFKECGILDSQLRLDTNLDSDRKMSSACEEDIFTHSLLLTKWKWVQIYLLGFVLVPIRVFVSLLISTLMWTVALFAMFGLTEKEKTHKPFTGWRKLCQKIIIFLGKNLHRTFGFSVTIKGKCSERAPICIAAPHTTYLDSYLMHWLKDLPSIVSRKQNKKIPVAGAVLELSQSLYCLLYTSDAADE